MLKIKNVLHILIFLIAVTVSLTAQENKILKDEDFLNKLREMALTDIMDMKISVASQIPLSMREAPGIVTLVTREDILNSGARDLVDVFTQLVPGFTFLQSDYGPIGLGVRGLWAYEGKVLLLIDGVEANDEGFGGIIFGNHFSIENIERIEVIRGPGSVIYGGYAGLGVINIITRSFEKKPGSYVSTSLSRMYDTYSHRNISFGIGNKENEFKYSVTGFTGQGRLSDRTFVPYFSKPEKSGSTINFTTANLNINMNYKGYDVRAFLERYKQEYDIDYEFSTLLLQLKKNYKIADWFHLDVNWNAKLQKPWELRGQSEFVFNGQVVDTTYSNNKSQNKSAFAFNGQFFITKNLHLLTGIEYTRTEVEIGDPEPGVLEIPFGSIEENYDDISAHTFISYAQLMFKNDIFNVTVGGRYESDEHFGTSFVPRLALTKIFGPFHFKLMASKSFRVPGGKYYDLNLKPEKGINYEVETGVQFSKNHFMVLNLFDELYKDVISYKLNSDSTAFYYDNQDVIRSRGFELEYKYVGKIFRLGSNFSYATIIENTVDAYKVPEKNNRALGFPEYQFNIFAGINISKHLSINPSFTFFGPRYGYIEGFIVNNIGKKLTTNEQGVLKEFEFTTMLNVNFRTKDILTKGLNIDLGIRNLFNNDFEYIQPFNGYKAPLPAPTSSLILRINYESNFTF